jgi:hypothetical protein
MPRFASGETGRKGPSDTIQKMKRLLATAISRHATLQHENQQLQQEYQLLQAVCGAFGMKMSEVAAALLLQQLKLNVVRSMASSAVLTWCSLLSGNYPQPLAAPHSEFITSLALFLLNTCIRRLAASADGRG